MVPVLLGPLLRDVSCWTKISMWASSLEETYQPALITDTFSLKNTEYPEEQTDVKFMLEFSLNESLPNKTVNSVNYECPAWGRHMEVAQRGYRQGEGVPVSVTNLSGH